LRRPNNFTQITPITVAITLAIQIGTIISPGFAEPCAARSAMIVVGISWIDAVLITTNIIISFDAVREWLLSLSSSPIAFMPSGVAALPMPRSVISGNSLVNKK